MGMVLLGCRPHSAHVLYSDIKMCNDIKNDFQFLLIQYTSTDKKNSEQEATPNINSNDTHITQGIIPPLSRT